MPDRYEEAAAFYRERIRRGVAGHADFHNHAVTCYKRGEFDQALESVRAALGADGDVSQTHYLRGLILKEGGRPEESVAAFDRAITLEPDVGKAFYHRGTARFLAGDAVGAVTDFQRAVEADPSSREAHFDLAVAAVGARRWETAREALITLLEVDPGGRRDYARLLCEIGRAEAIEEIYGQAHRIKNRIGLSGNRMRALAKEAAAAATEPLPPLGRLEADGDDAAPIAAGPGRRRHDETTGRFGTLAAEIEATRAEIDRLYSEMNGMLHAIRQEPLARDLIGPNELVGRVLFAASAGLAEIVVERDLDPDVPDILGDPSAIEEALLNVVVNAGDAVRGRPGAKIVVSTREIDEGEHVAFSVADNGPGIDGDIRAIFRFGFTTKDRGSGVGLPWSESVIRAHGGRIEAENRTGEDGEIEGATFRIILPLSSDDELHVQTLSLRSLLFEDLRDLVVREEGDREGAEGLRL